MGLQLAIIGVLAGTALGLRYTVFVLVPAIIVAMIFTAIAGIAHGDHLGSIILAMVIVGATVQFGYLTGIAIHAVAGPNLASWVGGRSQLNSRMHNWSGGLRFGTGRGLIGAAQPRRSRVVDRSGRVSSISGQRIFV